MTSYPLTPDGVVVTSNDLQAEVQNRISDDNGRLADLATPGVASGFAVTVNGGNNARADIALGEGYTPAGYFIKTVATVSGLALQDYTTSTVNVIALMYTEGTQNARSHETNGSAPATLVVGSYRPVAYTHTNFAALPTSNSDFTQDSKDRALVVALVTANGFTVNVPTALTAASIRSANALRALALSLYQVTPPAAPNCTGLEAAQPLGPSSISIPTTGNGTLSATYSGTPGALSASVTWQAPSDGSPGSPVVFSTVTSARVSSSNGESILVSATPYLFPAAATHTDTLAVAAINPFAQTDQLYALSAEDAQHRNLLGNGTVTTSNPHGVRMSDIALLGQVGQGLVVGGKIPDSAAFGSVPRSMYLVGSSNVKALISETFNTSGVVTTHVRTYLVSNVSGFTQFIFAPINGSTITTVNAYWDFVNNRWTKDVAGAQATAQMVSANLTADMAVLVATATWLDAAWILEKVSYTVVAGSDTVGDNRIYGLTSLQKFQPGGSLSASTATTLGTLATYSNSSVTGRWLIQDDQDTNSTLHMRRYVDFASRSIIDTVNAVWNGSQWARDVGGQNSSRFDLTVDGSMINSYYPSGGGSPWADGAWTQIVSITTSGNTFASLTLSNITSSTAPSANTIYATNTPKAWGVINLNAGSYTLTDGFNINATIGTPTDGLSVQFLTNITGGYNVTTSMSDNQVSGFNYSGTSHAFGCTVATGSTVSTGFSMRLLSQNGASNIIVLSTAQIATLGGQNVYFTVFGRQ